MKSSIDRRGFLKTSASALALSAAARPAAAQQADIRVGMIGLGNRGTTLQRQVLEQPNAPIMAICDIDANKRDAALSRASQFNPKAYTDYRELLERDDIDAVHIATPCYLHAEMAAAALKAGKWVYCEKPLGITPEQVDMVLKAQRGTKTFLQIGQQLRYFPAVREVIRQLHEVKVLGRSFVIKAQRHGTPAKPGSQRADGRNEQRLRPAWYEDVKTSGDLIVENAIHNIDVCNWMAGSRPVSAYGHGKKYLPEPIPAGTEMMDGFSVEYIYENDMHLDYSQLYLHPRKMSQLKNGQWWVIFGEKGSLEVGHDDGIFYDMWGEQEPVNLIPKEIAETKEDAMAQFFQAVREKKRPFADIEVGAVAALTAIMGREAIYQRRMVTWKEMGVEI